MVDGPVLKTVKPNETVVCCMCNTTLAVGATYEEDFVQMCTGCCTTCDEDERCEWCIEHNVENCRHIGM